MMIPTQVTQLKRKGLFVIVCSLIRASFSQETCTCQPSRYRLLFNFSQGCVDSTVKAGDIGIDDVACTVQSLIENPIPAEITSVEVSELDQNLLVVSSMIYDNRTYRDGDSIRYSSIIATARADLIANTTSRPRGLQVVMTALDGSFNQVINKWVVIFNNACDEAPVLTIGEKIGWTTLDNLIDPPSALCPYYDEDESAGNSTTSNSTKTWNSTNNNWHYSRTWNSTSNSWNKSANATSSWNTTNNNWKTTPAPIETKSTELAPAKAPVSEAEEEEETEPVDSDLPETDVTKPNDDSKTENNNNKSNEEPTPEGGGRSNDNKGDSSSTSGNKRDSSNNKNKRDQDSNGPMKKKQDKDDKKMTKKKGNKDDGDKDKDRLEKSGKDSKDKDSKDKDDKSHNDDDDNNDDHDKYSKLIGSDKDRDNDNKKKRNQQRSRGGRNLKGM